ncbi:HAD family hydrolase [Rheinheimera metallidurans]|uniref:HAD family hydrolase n=1 Tax=Rheinheimera metallidurans TaxID=2925781 RepID=UPI00300191FB
MVLSAVKAVVFDLDGTLVDSALDFASMCDDIGWPRGSALLEQLALVEDAAEHQRITQIICHHEMQGAKYASWMPGARECLQRLNELKMPLAILTRNMRSATQLTIERLKIPVQRVITREDCAAKPDPEGLLLLANELKLPVQNMLYVGDYIYDLQAASNAGMPSCLYLNEYNTHFSAHASWTFHHFDELTAALML